MHPEHNSYQNLVKDTLQWIDEQDGDPWIFTDATQVKLFSSPRLPPKTTPIPSPQQARPIPHPPLPAKPAPVLKSEPIPPPTPIVSSVKPTPAPQPIQEDNTRIQNALKKIAPHLKLSNQIPSDERAQNIATGWKENIPDTQVILLALDQSLETMQLLKNLGKAIQTEFGAVKIISGTRLEEEKRWEVFFANNQLKLIIATHGMQKFPELMRHYRALPAQSQAFLANFPLVTLSPPATYAESPEQKAILWKRLCQLLRK